MNKRLTTDEPLTNVETALNLFYNEYGQTWVLDGGPAPDYYDVSLYDYARRLIKAHGSEIDTDVEDIELGNAITDCLWDGPETIDGLIATLYTAAWAFAELRQKLKEYEDAEERGLLIHLPDVSDKDIEHP